MDIGRHVITAVLHDHSALKKFIDAGFDLGWLTDKEDFSKAGIFGDDTEPYKFILKEWEKTGEVPSREYFKRNYPAYRLPKSEMSLDELLSTAIEDRKRIQTEVAGIAFIDLHDKGEYDAALDHMEEAVKKIRKGSIRNHLEATPVSSIKIKPVRWLWQYRLRMPGLSLAVGKPDIGKSQFAVWLAAQVSNGTLDGDLKGQPHGVIYVATEDEFEDTIAPRLVAAGADLDRVFRVDSTEQPGKNYCVSMVRDLDEIHRLITDHDVKLLILDPLMEVFGGTEWNKQEQVRPALAPLRDMLTEVNCAALGLMHFRKAFSDDVLTQVSGSGAWGQVIRSGVAFITDPDADEKTVVMSQLKGNHSPAGQESLTYTFQAAYVETEED